MIDINPFDPQTVVLLGVLNPATILVAFLLGRTADQWQKIPVAAFAGAFAGFLLYWLAATLGLFSIHALGGEAGMLLVGFASGLVWAVLGYKLFPAARSS
ncbi:MAG: hypothetical protein B7Y80_06655 [Hyphomicrobium sp. 32-62-53]|nr:MAG: hypothetical protein B7Z29_04865 [Hyphomicrobium sp. 12-62-95]OYY00306.1 MAG: hypothetical protein B7Y80_06655 [Hyphomicrobium sp. 32-62-53]